MGSKFFHFSVEPCGAKSFILEQNSFHKGSKNNSNKFATSKIASIVFLNI